MKEKLFKPIYWIMLILLSIDFIDTNIRVQGHNALYPRGPESSWSKTFSGLAPAPQQIT